MEIYFNHRGIEQVFQLGGISDAWLNAFRLANHSVGCCVCMCLYTCVCFVCNEFLTLCGSFPFLPLIRL